MSDSRRLSIRLLMLVVLVAAVIVGSKPTPAFAGVPNPGPCLANCSKVEQLCFGRCTTQACNEECANAYVSCLNLCG